MGQGVLGELYALLHFGQYVGALGSVVLILDAGGKFVFVLFHQLQNFFERCFALAPGHVGTTAAGTFVVGGAGGAFAIFEVQARDAIMILLNDRYRGLAVHSVIMANV